MDDLTFSRESFRATIAFSVLVLAALFLAALWWGDAGALTCALLAIAAAYVSQSLATHGVALYKLRVWALAAQVASAALWLIGFALLAPWRA